MTTTPWAADTPTLIAAGAITHLSTAVITTQDGDVITADVIDGVLSFDEGRSPRVELTLTIQLSTDPAMVERIDPRLATRVALAVGYARPDGTNDVQQIADLALRTKTRNRPDDTVELAARSDEALCIDNAASPTLAINAPNTQQAIVAALQLALPTLTTGHIHTVAGDLGAAVSFNEANVDKWTAIQDFADRIGAVVYDDGLREFWIADRPDQANSFPHHTITDGPAGTVTTITDNTDREGDYANRVQIVNTWTTSAGVEMVVVGTGVATGAYAPTPGNTRTLLLERDTPTTGAQANLAAGKYAARSVTRGRVFTLTAVSAYWLRPGHTVAVVEAGLPVLMLLVTAVEFDLRTGLMDVRTRQPDGASTWNSAPPTLQWDQVPATQTWNTSY